MTTTTAALTRREEIQERIRSAQDRYNALHREALDLGRAEHEAQKTGDPQAVLAVHLRGEQLPAELGLTKAERLEAEAELEALAAAQADTLAEPYIGRVAALEQEMKQLEGEWEALRDERDSHLQAANMHRMTETELRYEARKLRDLHTKESGEGRGVS